MTNFRWRHLAPAGVAAVALAVGSCESPMACTSAAPMTLLGAWNYSATQSSPSTAGLGGTLEITSQCGGTFNGTLNLTETDAQGSRHVAGPVNGRALDPTAVDFDAFLTVVGRRHLGSVARDSIQGTWVEQSEAGTASGSFLAVKAP